MTPVALPSKGHSKGGKGGKGKGGKRRRLDTPAVSAEPPVKTPRAAKPASRSPATPGLEASPSTPGSGPTAATMTKSQERLEGYIQKANLIAILNGTAGNSIGNDLFQGSRYAKKLAHGGHELDAVQLEGALTIAQSARLLTPGELKNSPLDQIKVSCQLFICHESQMEWH